MPDRPLAVVDAGPVAFVLLTPLGTCLDATRAAEAYVGDRVMARGRRIWDLLATESFPFRAALDQLIDGVQPSAEQRVRDLRVVLARSDRNILCTLGRDTDTAVAPVPSQELQRLRRAEHALVGVLYEIDVDRGTVWRSRGVEELLGVDPGELPPTAEAWTSRIPPDDFAAAMAVGRAAIQRRAPRWRTEYRVRHRDGHHVHVVDHQYAEYDATGRLLRLTGTTMDVTALRHALDAERDARDAAQRAAEFAERFVAMVGHDLRTPLTAIRLGAELVRLGADEASARVLDRILSSAGRMERMLDQLLDFARVRMGAGLEVRPSPVDLGVVTRDVLAEVTSRTDRPLATTFVGNLGGTWDADRLAQVLDNLLSNAVAHGGDPIELIVDGRAPDVVTLEVSNRGEVSESLRAVVFEPFRGTSRSRGLGLGMFITRCIVEAHGGTVDVRCADGTTTFCVVLPRLGRSSDLVLERAVERSRTAVRADGEDGNA